MKNPWWKRLNYPAPCEHCGLCMGHHLPCPGHAPSTLPINFEKFADGLRVLCFEVGPVMRYGQRIA